MKVRKIESLKKNVLIVDGREFDYEIFKSGIFLKDENGQFNFTEGKWKLLGKLKDLTESDFEPLVKSLPAIFNPELKDYKNYTLKNKLASMHYNLESAKESFLSALESEGLHLHGNPLWNKPRYDYQAPSEYPHDYYAHLEKWQEAEQNVFSENTLIFVEP